MMHIQFLVEDQSGKIALDLMHPLVLEGINYTAKVHAYRGIGRIPKGIKSKADASKRILLDQLPKLLRGHATTYAAYGGEFSAAVVVVCDLDNRDLEQFTAELLAVATKYAPGLDVRFCIAVEEGEAWFLGDKDAVQRAYPQARQEVLNSYIQDSICGTWETLADAVHPGGSAKLKAEGWPAPGKAKCEWADLIPIYMDVKNNQSNSFNSFRSELLSLFPVSATGESLRAED